MFANIRQQVVIQRERFILLQSPSVEREAHPKRDVGGVQPQPRRSVSVRQHQGDVAQRGGLTRPRLSQDHQPLRLGQGVADPLPQALLLDLLALPLGHRQEALAGLASLLLPPEAQQPQLHVDLSQGKADVPFELSDPLKAMGPELSDNISAIASFDDAGLLLRQPLLNHVGPQGCSGFRINIGLVHAAKIGHGGPQHP